MRSQHLSNPGGTDVARSASRAPESYIEDGGRIAGTADGSQAAPVRRLTGRSRSF